MLKYCLRKVATLLVVLLLVSVVTFFIIHLTPGDPASVMLGTEATADAVEALREQMGFNRPIPVQYVEWLGDILHGDLGNSIFMEGTMLEIIGERLLPTIELTCYALLVATIIAIPTGILAAKKHGRIMDQGMMVFSMLGVSVPNFLLGLLLVLAFAVGLKWLPASGYKEFSDGIGKHFRYMILPSISLGLMHAALMSRMTRSAILEVLNKDYIKMAKAKGVKARSLLYKHALRNALIPIITVIAQSFVALMAGALVSETIFNIPGIGKLVMDSIMRRDYEVVQALILMIATFNVVIMFVLDILYGVIDPRVRSEVK